MKLIDLLTRSARQPGLKAKLNETIKLDNGKVLKKGTVSVVLVDKGDGTYHFEAKNTACTVKHDELTFLS